MPRRVVDNKDNATRYQFVNEVAHIKECIVCPIPIRGGHSSHPHSAQSVPVNPLSHHHSRRMDGGWDTAHHAVFVLQALYCDDNNKMELHCIAIKIIMIENGGRSVRWL